MPKKTYTQKDNPMMTQLMLIIALVVIAVFLFTLKTTMPQPVPSSVSPTPEVTDFNGTSTELNGVDVDQIDSGLNQINNDASTF